MDIEPETKRNVAIAVAVAVIFVLCSVWAYYTYIRPNIYKEFVDNKEFRKGVDLPKEATLFFFGTTWCPHCKSATKTWEDYKKSIGGNGSAVNGVVITFREVDCDKESKLAATYNVKGYPTIKLERGPKVVEFDSKPTVPLLKQFVDQMTADG
jgi:thiol-disulfide isomerase/thioredoxin